MLRKPDVRTSEPTVSRRFPIGLTAATAIAIGILLVLGGWQMQRLAWKEALLHRIAALQDAPAQPLADVLARAAAGENVDFTRVELECPGLAKAPYVELYALREGGAGSRIISACPASAGYGSVLVDRGFVADTISARPPVDAADRAPLHVVGVLRQPDPRSFAAATDDPAHRKFYTRNAAAMAGLLGVANPAPMFVLAETATNPEWAALVPAPIPADIPNRHLEYALTWFGLAATLACVYAAMLWRRLQAPPVLKA
jgi:surfeit locus 1 family protein